MRPRVFVLPFGYVPGQAHDPMAWVEFIRAYQEQAVSKSELGPDGQARARPFNSVAQSLLPSSRKANCR